MNDKLNKNEDVDLLEGFTADFPDWFLEKFVFELKPEALINVFCCKVATLDQLASDWRPISSFIGAKSITLSLSNFTRWNSYLVYFCAETVPRSLKYEIENDKFASRKMVEGEWSGTSKSMVSFLNEELLLSHINFQSDSASQARNRDELSEFGQRIVTKGISAGMGNLVKKNRKSWLDATMTTEAERLTNEN